MRVGDRVGRGAREGGDAAVDESRIGGVERGEHGYGRVWFGEVERRGHVAHGRATPGGEVGDLGTEAGFEKTQDRGVIEYVG